MVMNDDEMDQVQVASTREEARSKTQRRARIASQGMATPGGGGDSAEEEDWNEEINHLYNFSPYTTLLLTPRTLKA